MAVAENRLVVYFWRCNKDYTTDFHSGQVKHIIYDWDFIRKSCGQVFEPSTVPRERYVNELAACTEIQIMVIQLEIHVRSLLM